MTRIPLDEIKRHCQADGYDDDDQLLTDLTEAAEDYVLGYVRRDLDNEFPDGWPDKCKGAVKFLVAFWYESRDAIDTSRWSAVRNAVKDMLANERSFI